MKKIARVNERKKIYKLTIRRLEKMATNIKFNELKFVSERARSLAFI